MFDEKLWLFVHNHISKKIDKGLVVFGTGSGAMKTVSILGIFAKDILYFVDNFLDKSMLYGKEVKRAEDLKNKKTKPFVLIASDYYDEISKQLIDFGYRVNDDFICSVNIKQNIRDYTVTNFINGVKVGRFTYGYEKHCFKGTVLEEIGSFCSINIQQL